jgi:hypothetical protein
MKNTFPLEEDVKGNVSVLIIKSFTLVPVEIDLGTST